MNKFKQEKVMQDKEKLTEIDFKALSSCLEMESRAADKLPLVTNVISGSFQPWNYFKEYKINSTLAQMHRTEITAAVF